MFKRKTLDPNVARLILEAEREAQFVSAFVRLIVAMTAVTIFLVAGGANLPVAPVVLTYLGTYALISAASLVFSLERLFIPWLSLVFTAFDGCALALLVGFALNATGAPFGYHSAVPGFVFLFCIMILATMRYTIGPVIVVFASFSLTLAAYYMLTVAGDAGAAPDPAGQSAGAFYFGPVQNAARWGFLTIAALLSVLAVWRRRKTLITAIANAQKSANLSRYLPDPVADVAADQGLGALTSGAIQPAVVLFVDIRGFTGISERTEPAELGRLLGAFRSLVSKDVEAHGGFVDKFIGDAVMAVFGAPANTQGFEVKGLACAVAISDRVKGWRHGVDNALAAPITVSIGAHYGDVFAGAIGDDRRMEYTVLGDTVNVAARLQEASKATASGLVVSEELLTKARGTAGGLGAWSFVDELALRGREAKVRSYTLD